MASDSKLDEKFNAGAEASAETSQQAVVVDINEQASHPSLVLVTEFNSYDTSPYRSVSSSQTRHCLNSADS